MITEWLRDNTWCCPFSWRPGARPAWCRHATPAPCLRLCRRSQSAACPSGSFTSDVCAWQSAMRQRVCGRCAVGRQRMHALCGPWMISHQYLTERQVAVRLLASWNRCCAYVAAARLQCTQTAGPSSMQVWENRADAPSCFMCWLPVRPPTTSLPLPTSESLALRHSNNTSEHEQEGSGQSDLCQSVRRATRLHGQHCNAACCADTDRTARGPAQRPCVPNACPKQRNA